MQRRWRETVDEFKGNGTARDSKGRSAEVAYRLLVQRNMRDRPSINQPNTIVAGSYELSGTLSFLESTTAVDIDENLILTLRDGREVEIIITTISDPREVSPFVVSDSMQFLESYE
jgi:hypothetical protein